MKIQSLSIDVPPISGGRCINNCAFCVAKMNQEDYKNQMDDNLPFYDLYRDDYLKRLAFARDNGCNTVMLTGNIDPQQNRGFLTKFAEFNSQLAKPFRIIEMQTTGAMLDRNYLRFLRNAVGVSTISLSLSNMFDNDINQQINGTPEVFKVDIKALCAAIKEYDFNLRLSLNMTKYYNDLAPKAIFSYAAEQLGADQITFRILYENETDCPQNQWIKNNRASHETLDNIRQYIQTNGCILGILEYGQKQYEVHQMSIVIDDDCMSQEITQEYKYLILRPNCKLYSRWETKASLIF